MNFAIRRSSLSVVVTSALAVASLALGSFGCTQPATGGGGGSGGGGSEKSTTSSGVTSCAEAASKIADKLKACEIPQPTAPGSRATCTATQAQETAALANCVVAASCDALTGKDVAGSASYAQCVVDAAPSAASSGPSGPATSSSSGSMTSGKATSTGVTSAQASSSGSGLSACDTGVHGSLLDGATSAEQQVCTSCVVCSEGDRCIAEWQAFGSDPSYAAYEACNSACGPSDLACYNACSTMYPGTDAALNAALGCSVCEECVVNCDAAHTCS